MPFCEKCGGEHDEDAAFCPKCGRQLKGKLVGDYVELATWGQRFIALLIDAIPLMFLLAFLQLPGFYLFKGVQIRFGLSNIIQFLYYLFMDYYYGQSIGKMVMKLRITKFGGGPLTLMDAAIECFGKVFLLPIDFLIGYFMYKNQNQRLFNYLSDTVVIRDEIN